jgi:hypothetical protein
MNSRQSISLDVNGTTASLAIAASAGARLRPVRFTPDKVLAALKSW